MEAQWFRCSVDVEGQWVIFPSITSQYRKLALKGAFTGAFHMKPLVANPQNGFLPILHFAFLAKMKSCSNISFQFIRAAKQAEQKNNYSIKITSCIIKRDANIVLQIFISLKSEVGILWWLASFGNSQENFENFSGNIKFCKFLTCSDSNKGLAIWFMCLLKSPLFELSEEKSRYIDHFVYMIFVRKLLRKVCCFKSISWL